MKKIAIVRRNGLGDLLTAFPLILYIRKRLPKAKITLFADKRNAPLLPYLPKVDEVVLFPHEGNKYVNVLKTAWKYRTEKFDLAICSKTSPMKLMNFFLFALGAKRRAAYVDDSWHRRLINYPLFHDPVNSKKLHQALKCLHLVAPELQEIPEELYPKLSIPPELRRGIPPPVAKGPVILVTATTTRVQSRFDPERYGRILNYLYQLHPFSVRIVGETKDRVRAALISEGLKMPYSIHFPRNFADFMLLLESSDLYFVGDGGVAHIGAGFDKSQVVLFGETDPCNWHPLSEKATALYHPIHVNAISDEVIFDAVKQRLEEVVCARANC